MSSPKPGKKPGGLQRFLLEPGNALTHIGAAVAAVPGTWLLLYLARGQEAAKMASLAVYGASMFVLFSASGLFHGIRLADNRRMWLNRLDHAAIYLLIAGTYTPIVYNQLPEAWSKVQLTAMWLLALIGVAYKMLSKRIHGFVNASTYLVLGWSGLVTSLVLYWQGIFKPSGGLGLLLLGGLIYSVGFLVYYFQRPNPWPKVFGHHELWHVLVVAGNGCFFVFMLLYVVPAQIS